MPVTQFAKASWYGMKFHGKKTASGEIFNMYGLTAAHRELPFDTHVKVTNLLNNEEIMVRINDRGPYHEGRSLDLSYGAAEKLKMLDRGVIPVRMVIVPPEGDGIPGA